MGGLLWPKAIMYAIYQGMSNGRTTLASGNNVCHSPRHVKSGGLLWPQEIMYDIHQGMLSRAVYSGLGQ